MRIKRHSEGNYILIIVGVIFVSISSIFTLDVVKLLINGEKTIGVVTNIHESHSDDGTSYSVTAKYDCGSKTGIVGSSLWSSSSYNYKVGEKIKIYCNEQNPGSFLPRQFTSYLIFLFPIMGFLVLGFGIKKIVDKNKRKKLKQELMQFGTKVEATVISVSKTGAEVNKQPGYRITAQYLDNTFESEEIFADIYKIIKQGDKIDVYLDYGDHSKYWMDTDSIFERDYDNTMIIN